MNDQLTGAALGLLGGSAIAVAAWLLSDSGFLLLSALGVAWVGAIAAVYSQRELVNLSGAQSRQERLFTFLILYVVIALPNGISPYSGQGLVVILITIGILGVGIGSMQTAAQQ